jgi:uncharacterized membrane protein YhaH (DUF805 family)
MEPDERLRRLQEKAAQRETSREREQERRDSIEAIREVYQLSEAEVQQMLRDIDAEIKAEEQARQQRQQKRELNVRYLRELLFSARGRISRGDFWIAQVGVLFVHSVIAASAVNFPALGVFSLLCWFAHLNLAIKRCHDRGRSGWFLVLGWIPVVQIWPLVELMLLPGEPETNRFGEPVE